VPVSPDGSCRLCHKHRNLAARLLGRRIATVTLAEANAHGQQLFIAGTWRPAGTPRREYVKKTVPADMSVLRPVPHCQLVMFDMTRDLRLGLWDKFPPPPDPAPDAASAQFVRDHAAAHGWAKNYTATIQRDIRIMLGISAEHIRLDRIYQEAEATGGDIRALCDLFGMSIANAARCATTIDHITATPTPNAQNQPLGGH